MLGVSMMVCPSYECMAVSAESRRAALHQQAQRPVAMRASGQIEQVF